MLVGCIPTHLQFPSLSLSISKSQRLLLSLFPASSLSTKVKGIHKKWRMIGIYMRWSEAAPPLPPRPQPRPPPPPLLLLAVPSSQGKTKTCSAYKICLNLGRREMRADGALTTTCMICTGLSFGRRRRHRHLNLRSRLCNERRQRRLSPRRTRQSHPSLFSEDYQICLPPTKSSNHTFLPLRQSFTRRNNLSPSIFLLQLLLLLLILKAQEAKEGNFLFPFSLG